MRVTLFGADGPHPNLPPTELGEGAYGRSSGEAGEGIYVPSPATQSWGRVRVGAAVVAARRPLAPIPAFPQRSWGKERTSLTELGEGAYGASVRYNQCIFTAENAARPAATHRIPNCAIVHSLYRRMRPFGSMFDSM